MSEVESSEVPSTKGSEAVAETEPAEPAPEASEEAASEPETETSEEAIASVEDAPAEKSAAKAKSAAPAKSSRVVRLLGDATDSAWVRRKIAVFRRLEPGDVRSEGSHVLEESPYLEARLLELALPTHIHDEMVELEKKRREARAIATGYFRSYDPAGMLFATGGTGLFGVWFDYLPRLFFYPSIVLVVLGILVGFLTKRASRLGIAEGEKRWSESADRKAYNQVAKDVSEAWIRAANTIRREDGFYTDLRVAEGSADPVRIASLDPRPYTSDPPAFDPDDFLPSVATGDDCPVRYEQVHATGEVITKSVDGSRDFAEEPVAKA